MELRQPHLLRIREHPQRPCQLAECVLFLIHKTPPLVRVLHYPHYRTFFNEVQIVARNYQKRYNREHSREEQVT
jgi:hypothetical protein